MSNINVTRSSMPEFSEYCEEIKELWESHWLTNMGAKHKQLEKDLKEYLNTPNITLFANGHLALENVIEAFGFKKGSEVITTPFTFASTTHAIYRNGLIPVFCDINKDTYTIDAEKIEALITEKTCAIVPVHVYGNLCDIDRIDEIAKKHNLKVIYDAAHAFGVTKNGISAANFGDASMFSFHATKVFNTIEGGAVCYNDFALVKILDATKNFGIYGKEHNYAAGNAKLNEFAAAMGICNLRHLSGEIEKRKAVTEHYRKRLGCVNGIKLCETQQGVVSNYSYFPVVFDGYKLTRDQVHTLLAENKIIARKYFYPLTSTFECYKHLSTAGEDKTPIAKDTATKILSLPLYADLTIEDVDRICDVILSTEEN